MAEVKLNTTSSVIDFLKSQGKASDLGSRKSLYDSLGLSTKLGSYVGSNSQNTAFLKTLQTPTQTQAVTPVATPGATGALDTARGQAGTINRATGQITNVGAVPAPASAGFGAQDALAGIPAIPSSDEILGQVLNSPSFQNYQQSQQLDKTLATGDAEAQKAQLESKSLSDTKQFIESMGRRGLFFSGETNTGIQDLAESLASSKLNIDRKLAGDLLKADFQTRDTIIKMVGDVVKEAQAGRKEALDSLEKVGLTVIGGQVVPTLQAQNAALSQEREERLAQTAAFNQLATLERLEQSAAAADRAEAYLRLAEQRAAQGLAGSKLSISDVKSLGLPIEFVGLSESGVVSDLSSSKPPAWFVASANESFGGNVLPEIVQQQWNDFKGGVDSRLAGDDDGNLY